MMPIHVLERSVAERIAAGEVIERPASVAKELVENGLDAGARSITVETEGAGLRLIRVTDDGEGIPRDQVGLAFERFATSKIACVEDLGRVTSYGFRGEALPSIAAVARVTLTTRTRDASGAVRVVIAGGVAQASGAHGAPPGTVVEVSDLFYNTPARLKFLKSPAREQALLAEAVERAAMAHPEVAFRLVADGRETGWWPRTNPARRVAALLGAGAAQDLIPVQGMVPAGTFHGWLGRPEHGRANRAGAHLFVNRRPVQSALLRRAAEQGYAQLMPLGRFPAFALFVEVDPAALDVNVHPRKMEVRFREESRLFAAVAHGVREALLSSPLIRRVVAGTAIPEMPSGGEMLSLLRGVGEDGAREVAAAYSAPPARRLPALRPIGQLLNTYVLAEGGDGLYLIDQHAAHERILYERLIAARRRGRPASQGLAVPLVVELVPSQMAMLTGHADHFAQMGFEVEPFGAGTAILRAVPATVPGIPGADLLLGAMAGLQGDGEGDPLERIAIATACHTAIRAGDRLSHESVTALLADLNAAEDPFTCFHGRPTIIAVSREQIERWFLRG